MQSGITIILIAMFIEAIVSAIKPIWSTGDDRMSVAEIVSIVVGIVLAVSCKINMLYYISDINFAFDTPDWVNYLFYILTGVALGRGPSFIWDLWERIRQAVNVESTVENVLTVEQEAEVNAVPDMNIGNWSLAQIKDFCKSNGIDVSGCTLREEFEYAITRGGRANNDPPTDGGAV